MQCTNIYTAFNQSLRWNAALYFFYKILSTAVSFLLFNRLTVNDFSVWANINSFIFLLLLWLDCGLRKSIPRYCPEFEQNGSLYTFLSYVLCVQAGIFIVAIPLFLGITTLFFHSLSLSYSFELLYCGAFILLFEGINSSIKLFYHAHFWNKTYTLIQSIILLFEMGISIIFIATCTTATYLLFSLFITKLTTSCINTFIGFFFLKKRYKSKVKLKSLKKRMVHSTVKMFIRHSTIMWFSTLIKSLTERNFLVPFLSYSLGPVPANLFKIANDWAMLIHRPIIKAIGSSDTALLSHVETKNESSTSLKNCRHLLKKILFICSPFFAALLFIAYFINHATVVALFLIIGCGHILETILSPYERILEVKQNYRLLVMSYVPYIAILVFFTYYFAFSSISIITLFLLIHSTRLFCSLLMVYHAHKAYSDTSITPAIFNFFSVSLFTKNSNQRLESQ